MASTALPTLRQLLRLSFSEPVRWLSEPATDDARVSWVSVRPEEVQPGDLLLLPAEAFTRQALEDAQADGAAAVLVLGRMDEPRQRPAVPLPIAALNDPTDLRSAQQTLLTILVNQRVGQVERGARVHNQLSQLAAQGGGLEGLARAMAEISGRGVLVQDKRLDILAHQPSSTLTGIWGDILEQLCDPESLPPALRDRKTAGRETLILLQSLPGGLSRRVATISVGDVARGYISLVGLEGELDVLDQTVIEQGALVCAIEMSRAKAVREAEKRLKGDLLAALLQNDLSPRDARLWVLAMGLDLDNAHVALRFAWDAATPPSRRRLETLVNGEVTRRGLKTIVHPMGAEVACFCEVPSDSARSQAVLDFSQAVLEQGSQEYPSIPIRCGIGRPAADLSDWRSSFQEAGQALEMARRFGDREPLFYPDLSVYRLLLQIEHSPELSAYQEEILGRLLAHENFQELLHTLEAYFEHNGNISQTAEALFIHRNTLMYRMDRIQAITGLDLEDAKNRLALQLALHIHRMVGSKRA
jgi:purine catabolism regulator